MSKIEINASKSGFRITAEGIVAPIIGIAVAVGGLAVAVHYFPAW